MGIETWICQDCMIAAVNNDYSGLDEARYKEVTEGIEGSGWLVPDFGDRTKKGWKAAVDEDRTEDSLDDWLEDSGEVEFSTSACECCWTNLAGARFRFIEEK